MTVKNIFVPRRRNSLRHQLRQLKLDAYITFDFSDVCYLSGFPSEGCFLLASRAGDWMFSPLLLAEHARAHVKSDPGLKIVAERELLKSMQELCKKHSLKRIGFDTDKVVHSLYGALTRFPGVKWIPQPGLILRQRMIKDESELSAIRRACHITHDSAMKCFKSLKPGQTEKDVSNHISNLFFDGGSPKVAFETIVAFGSNAAFPHHVVSDKRLKRNSAVLLDMGCMVDGYRSDLTRASFFGKITRKYQQIFSIVDTAQKEGVAAVREGVSAGKIDWICREVIRKSGYGDFFVHGTGHGVGLDIHEPPRLGINSQEILKEGMIVTVEPGIYLPGEFGVRIEDSLLVKKNGCEILTK